MRLFISLLLLAVSNFTWACSCSAPELIERIESANKVLVGKVISIRDLKYVSEEDRKYSAGIEAVILVEELLKGEKIKRVTLYSSYNSNDCGMDFAIGDTHLFFLNSVRVNSCSGHVMKSRFSLDIYETSLKEARRLIGNGI